MIEKLNLKLQTLIDITNFCEDLDSTVEKTNYEDGAEKIRELEQKNAYMEKNKRTPSSNSKFCFV